MRVLALLVSSVIGIIFISKKKRRTNADAHQSAEEEDESAHYRPYHDSPNDAPPSYSQHIKS